MGKKARIISFGMNNRITWGKTQDEMLDFALGKIDSVRGYHPDLICLPELFLESAGDSKNPEWESISAKALAQLKATAADMHCWIAASLYETVPEHPEMRYITLYLLNREGEIAGKYRKYHTVIGETKIHRALPGSKPYAVVDTDFGRVGLLICFDIGWRDPWAELGKEGAKLVIWASAYNGGRLLHMHAAHNMYYVVSSVMTEHPMIIDMVGHTISEGTRWDAFAMADVDLDTTIFHTDRQWQKIDSLRAKLGDSVRIQSYNDENMFTVSSTDPEWPIERICKEFDMMTYADYHKEATDFEDETRRLYPTNA